MRVPWTPPFRDPSTYRWPVLTPGKQGRVELQEL